jgi:signal transduction histidine kinase
MGGEGNLDINVTRDDRMALITVKDTGKGIPRKNFKNVFNPGFTTKKRGWGLGLTLVKRIIEEYHNGQIYIKESEVGKGTTFGIELPKVK